MPHRLGLFLDLLLSLDSQESEVLTWNAFTQLHLVCQLQPFLSLPDSATILHTLVTSCLDYCSTFYVELPLNRVPHLQVVQCVAARLLTGAWCRDHMTLILKDLNWLPVPYCAQLKFLKF